MKLLFLNHNVAWSGGTFFRALAVAREVAQRGHDVTLLTISPRNHWTGTESTHHGVRIVETPDLLWGIGRTGWDPYDTAWRCAALRGEAWDVIHAWDSRPAVILPALFAHRQSRRAKLFIDWADWWGRGGTQAERRHGLAGRIYGPLETFFEERFRTRADGTTVISQALEQRAIGLGVPARSILRLPQGCEPAGEGLPGHDSARAQLGLPPDAPVFLAVGKLLPADAALLFAAAARLFSRHPDARLVLIGRHGATVPPALLATGQLTDAGFVSDELLQTYMGACDALVVALADTVASRARWPSKANGFLARGRAVIITRVGDLPAILESQGAAFLADATPESLAETMAAAPGNPARRAVVEHNARRVAREQLAWPVLVNRLLTFYAERTRGAADITAAAAPGVHT